MSEDTKRDDVLAEQSQHKKTAPNDWPSDYLQFQHPDLLSKDLADLQRLKLIAEIEKFAEEGKTSKLSARTSLRGSVIQAGATVLQTLGIGLATFFGINSLKPQLDLVKLEMSKLQEVQQKTAGSLKELSVGQTSLEQATREAKTATQQLRELGTQVTTLAADQIEKNRRTRLTVLFQKLSTIDNLSEESFQIYLGEARQFRSDLVSDALFSKDLESLRSVFLDTPINTQRRQTHFWALLFAGSGQHAAFQRFLNTFGTSITGGPVVAQSLRYFPAKEFREAFAKLELSILANPDRMLDTELGLPFLDRVREHAPKYYLWHTLRSYAGGCPDLEPKAIAANNVAFEAVYLPVTQNYFNSQIILFHGISKAMSSGRPVLAISANKSVFGLISPLRAAKRLTFAAYSADPRFTGAASNSDYGYAVFDPTTAESKDWYEKNRRVVEKLKCASFLDARNWPEKLIRKVLSNEWITDADI